MNMLEQARSAVTRCLAVGRDRADGLRLKRQRARLIGELGEASYARSQGVATADAEIDRIVAELDALGESDDGTPTTHDTRPE